MTKTLVRLALVAALTACGGSAARSGGTLPVPPDDTSTTSPTTATTLPAAPTTATGGQSPNPSTTTPAETNESTVVVYFLDESLQAVPVERVAEGPGVARTAVEALVAGPNRSEVAAGLATALPPDSLVLGLTIDGGLATVDMSLEFEAGGGSASILGRLAQLVYTLTEFDNIDRVRLLIEGKAVEFFSGEGVIVTEPLTRADYTETVPIGDDPRAASAPTWDQDDLGVQAGEENVYRVALVAADDYLNVRHRAGIEADVIGRLLPGGAVQATGDSAVVGSSTWREVRTPNGDGWVNAFYLTPSFADGAGPVALEPAALDLITQLSQRFAAGDDFTDLVSEKGLWVAHHAASIRFDLDELDEILDDDTTYRWGSNALEPGSPEIRPRTFSEAVADRFVRTYDDSDRHVLVGEAVEGPNGRPPEFALPAEFTGFPFVTVFDPGDNPEYGGLDWTTWMVSFSYEEGDLRVVGLTLDEWAP
jgi:hypothetical protein